MIRNTPSGDNNDWVGRRGGCLYQLGIFTLFSAAVITLVVFLFACAMDMTKAADLSVRNGLPRHYNMGELSSFGTYSDEYYARRWTQLCKGGGRYQAMSEAYERGKPDPCNGVKERLR